MTFDIEIVLSDDAETVYALLESQAATSKKARAILDAINHKSLLIKANHHYGNPIAKKKIPSSYIKRYNIKNLFRVELPYFWRLLYAVVDGSSEIRIVAFVTDIVDHKMYNKLFNYRKK